MEGLSFPVVQSNFLFMKPFFISYPSLHHHVNIILILVILLHATSSILFLVYKVREPTQRMMILFHPDFALK